MGCVRRHTSSADIGPFKEGEEGLPEAPKVHFVSLTCVLKPTLYGQLPVSKVFVGPAWALRLRRACLPYGPLYGETANGSLNVGPTTPMGLVLGMCQATHQFGILGTPLKRGEGLPGPYGDMHRGGQAGPKLETDSWPQSVDFTTCLCCTKCMRQQRDSSATARATG